MSLFKSITDKLNETEFTTIDSIDVNIKQNIDYAISDINNCGGDITFDFESYDDDFNRLTVRAYAYGYDGETFERSVMLKLDGTSKDSIYEALDTWATDHNTPDAFYESCKVSKKKLNEASNFGKIFLAEVGYDGTVGTCRGIGKTEDEAKENAFKLFKQVYSEELEDLMSKENDVTKPEIEVVDEYYGINTFDMSSGASNEGGNVLEESSLEPQFSSRKSFYGKARVEDAEDGGKTLISYTTPIMTIKDGNIEMLCTKDALSSTTMSHIREFLQQEGLEPLTKQQVIKLIENK